VKLSIVMPAYNEENRLRPTLDAYAPFFAERFGNDYELIVVVNGSRDRTEEVARDHATQWQQIKVIVDPRKIGKGGAIMRGFAAATGDLIGFVDADGATQPQAYFDLVQKIGDADCIIASRWIPGAHVSPKQPLKRRIASRIFNWLVKTLFDVRIHDTQCGAKLCKGSAVKKVLPDLGLTRWAFDVDLLFQLRRHGFSITEIPTTWQDVGGSQLQVGKASTEMFIAIIRLRLLHSPLHFIVTIYDRTLGRVVHPSP
jgi:glycosyltransferase involved in cell wall biosynthesis